MENAPAADDPMEPEDRFARNQSLSDDEQIPNIRVLSSPPRLGVSPRKNSTNVFYSFPNTPTRPVFQLPESSSDLQTPYGSDEEDDDHDDELPRVRPIAEPTRSRLHSILRRTKRRIVRSAKALNEFMTVPLWAALASLAVACVAPLQNFLKNDLQPVRGALTNAGNCSIPLTIVVLGAYFYQPPSEEAEDISRRRESTRSDSTQSFAGSIRTMLKLTNTSTSQRGSKDKDSRPGETKTVIVALVSRMIITPALLMPLVALCAKYDWHEVFNDPVFVVSNVLLVSSPPALTLAQITQAASGDAFERLISKTIFWSYCVLTPPLTILYVVIGLRIAQS